MNGMLDDKTKTYETVHERAEHLVKWAQLIKFITEDENILRPNV